MFRVAHWKKPNLYKLKMEETDYKKQKEDLKEALLKTNITENDILTYLIDARTQRDYYKTKYRKIIPELAIVSCELFKLKKQLKKLSSN